MATVKCKYCGQKFDRTTTAYVIPSARRYGHAECYLRQKEIDPKIPELTIYDPSNFVKCKFCNKEINKLEDEYIQLSNGKYAHKKCAEIEEKREKTDYEKLEAYILELFNLEYINPRIKNLSIEFTTVHIKPLTSSGIPEINTIFSIFLSIVNLKSLYDGL